MYQINKKFRDEIRPRFGLLCARQFIIADVIYCTSCDYAANLEKATNYLDVDNIDILQINRLKRLMLCWMTEIYL